MKDLQFALSPRARNSKSCVYDLYSDLKIGLTGKSGKPWHDGGVKMGWEMFWMLLIKNALLSSPEAIWRQAMMTKFRTCIWTRIFGAVAAIPTC